MELKPPQKQFNNQTQKTLEKFPQTTAETTWGSKQGRKRRKKFQSNWNRTETNKGRQKKRQRSQRSYTTRYKKQTTQRRYWNPGTKLRFEIANCQNRSCESNKATPEYETKTSSARNSPRKCKARASCSRRERERERKSSAPGMLNRTVSKQASEESTWKQRRTEVGCNWRNGRRDDEERRKDVPRFL